MANRLLFDLGIGTGTSLARYSTEGGTEGKYSGAKVVVIISLQ